MKRKLGILAVAFVVLFVSGCGPSPDLILGKWEAVESGLKVTAEFNKGGQMKLTMFGKPVRGTYKLNGDELEWTVDGKTTQYKVKVTPTEMELSSEGKTIKYRKVP